MNLARLTLLAISAAALSGCATRGAIAIHCDHFKEHVTRLESTRLLREIQGETGEPARDAEAALTVQPQGVGAAMLLSPLAQRIRALSQKPFIAQGGGSGQKPLNILLLSGGGQWGAFGAGYLQALQGKGSAQRVDYDMITGVSTGGLQALFVAIDREDPDAAYAAMAKEYRPEKESDLVDRGSKPMALLTGSFAGLDPLRRTIERALCTGGDPAAGCPMIEKLARSDREVLVGFVNAATGDFEYADVVALAREGTAGRSLDALRNAQQCLTGVTLASAAMPVFFQQVKINDQVYYDGGVRLSVFEGELGKDIDAVEAAAQAKFALGPAGIPKPAPASLYVVRNGPTRLLSKEGVPGGNDDTNRKADAITAAERAEAILVNQLEIGSIASLRLARPEGPIWLVTADGFHAWPGAAGTTEPAGTCPKGEGMFDPVFMKCLQRFGAHMAKTKGWRALSDLPRMQLDRQKQAELRAKAM